MYVLLARISFRLARRRRERPGYQCRTRDDRTCEGSDTSRETTTKTKGQQCKIYAQRKRKTRALR